jgi:hypothetical protein
MTIKANIDLSKAEKIFNRRYTMQQPCSLRCDVIVHSDEEPMYVVLLNRHAVNVRTNDKIKKGRAFMNVVPEWLLDAHIKW